MIVLRPTQEALVNDVRAAFREVRSVLMVAPTGFGKTVVFSYIAQSVMARDHRVYILVHRDELVEQVSRTLRDFNVPHGFIAAGRPPTLHNVMVCSVFTLANRIESYPQPQLLIIDEAHHACSGSTWARVLGFWRASFKLGVTATPIRLDGRDLTGQFDRMVEGPSVASLIGSGDLCKYRLFAPPVALGKLRIRMGDYVKSDIAAAIDKPSITGDAVAHYTKLAAGKRALVFCVSLEHAQHTADAFQRAGYTAARIDGGMDRGARRDLVARFSAGAVQVLTSCELVSEGFDLPAIEVAILLRPTASLGLYLQQVGRSLRPFPGKEHAIVLDHAGNAGTHGLPDDEREWSLGDDASRRGKRKASVSVRTCGRCYAAAPPRVRSCEFCGWQWPAEPREVEVKAGELEEVTVSPALIEARRARQAVGMAKSLSALQQLGRERGYNPMWAMRVFGSRKRA